MKTLLIGLGNPILGDDGVGWRVVEAISTLAKRLSPIEVDQLSLGGLSLMERMIGYEQVILIDALVTGENPPGYVSSFTLDQLSEQPCGHTSAAHDTSLQVALRVGKQMGAPLPEPQNILIVGIEILPSYEFSEQLSRPVCAAIPEAARQVFTFLGGIYDFS